MYYTVEGNYSTQHRFRDLKKVCNVSVAGLALQIQCYQCEEMTHDCSTPEFIVNCTVNVQDTCQKEVLVKDDGRSESHLIPLFQPVLHYFIAIQIRLNV